MEKRDAARRWYVEVAGMWDSYDEYAEPIELWLNVDSIVAIWPKEHAIVMGGDGMCFYCSPKCFERLCTEIGVNA